MDEKKINLPLSLPPELFKEVGEVARVTGLKKQEVVRQSLKRGLPLLLKALGEAQPEPAEVGA